MRLESNIDEFRLKFNKNFYILPKFGTTVSHAMGVALPSRHADSNALLTYFMSIGAQGSHLDIFMS